MYSNLLVCEILQYQCGHSAGTCNWGEKRKERKVYIVGIPDPVRTSDSSHFTISVILSPSAPPATLIHQFNL